MYDGKHRVAQNNNKKFLFLKSDIVLWWTRQSNASTPQHSDVVRYPKTRNPTLWYPDPNFVPQKPAIILITLVPKIWNLGETPNFSDTQPRPDLFFDTWPEPEFFLPYYIIKSRITFWTKILFHALGNFFWKCRRKEDKNEGTCKVVYLNSSFSSTEFFFTQFSRLFIFFFVLTYKCHKNAGIKLK